MDLTLFQFPLPTIIIYTRRGSYQVSLRNCASSTTILENVSFIWFTFHHSWNDGIEFWISTGKGKEEENRFENSVGEKRGEVCSERGMQKKDSFFFNTYLARQRCTNKSW